MENGGIKRILWAVDAFQADEVSENVRYLLGALTRSTLASIQPVYILGPATAQVPTDPFTKYAEAFEALAEKKLASMVAKLDMPNLLNAKILINPSESLRQDAKTLNDYAFKTKADLIVVSTRAGKGLTRLVFGSFAETLTTQSRTPVISVNPDTKVREKISNILFPTNFSSKFRKSFEKVVALSRELDAKVTLYYKSPEVREVFMRPELRAYLEEHTQNAIDRSQEWKQWAVHAGAHLNIEIDRAPGFLGSSILNYAEQNNMDLIAMATQSEPVSAFLLGSVTRQVVRESACPVWTIKVEEEG